MKDVTIYMARKALAQSDKMPTQGNAQEDKIRRLVVSQTIAGAAWIYVRQGRIESIANELLTLSNDILSGKITWDRLADIAALSLSDEVGNK